MKKQISRISILQTAKVAAAMYFAISLLMIVCFVFPAMMFSSANIGMPMFFVLIMPLFYVLFGFIFTVIAAWIYNIVASMIGGIEYTTTEIDKV